ncbi:MAG: hypothetical protein U7123_07275 [Potamolinea sp.]
MAEPNYEIQYKPVSYLNTPPILVAPSGGNSLAAVQRSEVDALEASMSTQLSSRLRSEDLAKNFAEIILDDALENVKRTLFTDNVGGIDYVFSTFEVYVDGWNTQSFWEVAMFDVEANKQINPEHDFKITAIGIANVIFQSNAAIENGKYRLILERIPAIPVVPVAV